MTKLIILRGLPDSNKDELVKDLFVNFTQFEADMFFMNNGVYSYNFKELDSAHKWCQQAVKKVLINGSNVIVTNTFVRQWELVPYLRIAKELDIEVEIITATGRGKNKTKVPQPTINKMRRNWEDVNLKEVMASL